MDLPWKEIITWALPFIIMGLVQLIKATKPQWKSYLPIIAPALGVILPIVASALSGWIGAPVDLSPILIAFGIMAGSAAAGLNQIPKQWKKRPFKPKLGKVEWKKT